MIDDTNPPSKDFHFGVDDNLYDNVNNVFGAAEFEQTDKKFPIIQRNNIQQQMVTVRANFKPKSSEKPPKPHQDLIATRAPQNYGVRTRGGAVNVPIEPPKSVEAKSKLEDGLDSLVDGDDGASCCSFRVIFCCIGFLILILIIVVAILATTGGDSRASVFFGTKEPTPSPTVLPTPSPTTPSPTASPTLNPTANPTSSPTTTFFLISTVCLGSSNEFRTSICLNDREWVRCEKDGTVNPQEDGDFIRTCETGDLCPCPSLHRVGISDPCVLEADAEESEITCTQDSLSS